MGREKSDGRTVPKGRRKAAPTGGKQVRGGKAIPARQPAGQLGLFTGTADRAKGDVAGVDLGQPRTEPSAVREPVQQGAGAMPAITMEAVARWDNLICALGQVAANQGAPGPDRQTIGEVREHLSEIMPKLQAELLEGRYQPGRIRGGCGFPKAGVDKEV